MFLWASPAEQKNRIASLKKEGKLAEAEHREDLLWLSENRLRYENGEMTQEEMERVKMIRRKCFAVRMDGDPWGYRRAADLAEEAEKKKKPKARIVTIKR